MGRVLPRGFYYVLPMGLFVAFTTVEGLVPRSVYPFVYLLKLLLVTVALAFCAPRWINEFRPAWTTLGLGILVGMLGFALWITLDLWTPHVAFLGTRTAFNPYEDISEPVWRATFIVIRLLGIALIVPVMEEVFWRSFVVRYITNPEAWQTVRIGAFTPFALGVSTLLFGFSHPEWLAAMAFALLMTWLCRATHSLFACTVAHAITNLALAIYVLKTGAWGYW